MSADSHRGFSTRDLLFVAALGAAFGVLFQLFGPVHKLYSSLGHVLGEWDYGVWFLPGLLAGALLQRPGVAIAAEMLAGAVSVLLGSPWGADVLVSAAVQGAACEIVFAAGRWRRFDVPVMLAAGALAGLFAYAHDHVQYGYARYAFWVQAGRCAIMIASGALLGGRGALGLARALARTGAVDQTPFGRQHRRAEE